MLHLALILFLAGIITILLPCILPLIPIVLGVSIAGRSKWRPLLMILGMIVSFVGFTFLLHVVLSQFVEVADYLQISTYYVLLLFGLGFLFHKRFLQHTGAILGGLFFWDKGPVAMIIAALLGLFAMHIGGRIATRIQQLGSDIQTKAQTGLGQENPLTAFIIGLTMGLVWVPCAGPALGFALTLVREQPGLQAFVLLTSYALGTAVPLLLIGYGGQLAVHSVRSLSRITGIIKQGAGAILILSALALQFHWFINLQIVLLDHTSYGMFGAKLEEMLFEEAAAPSPAGSTQSSTPSSAMALPSLPKLTRAPEFIGLGTWHNSEPLTTESLRGKVVLIDFWTYSCINCIRTLPYIQGYWEKFKDQPFVLIGVHTPEFVFEKSEQNVADAIKRHGLTYPVAQDNDFGTWRAFANRYWPAKYLIDAEGYIRYTHFGEGAYDETDKAIQSLLAEMGEEVSGEAVETVEKPRMGPVSPETYLGARSWPALQNAQGNPSDQVIDYEGSDALELHQYALVGQWQLLDDERQVLRSDAGEIRMRFQGGEINLVMGLEDGAAPGSVAVEVDGEEAKTFTVDRDDLYNLFTGDYGEHEIVIRISGRGMEAYAFTFGS